MITKIPYPGDLNTIETAVWAAEYVRVRATVQYDDVEVAIEHANRAVDELRMARERS